jgi:hypothetical protein
MERCLSQGTVSGELLAEAQRQLAEEAAVPVMLFGLRGERGQIDAMMTNLETGKITVGDILGKGGTRGWEIPYRLSGNSFKQDHAAMLRHYNKAVEIVKLPPSEIRARAAEVDVPIQQAKFSLMAMMAPAYRRLLEGSVRMRTNLECAIAGIGVERFRLKNGRWPASLEEVVSDKLLDKVLTDPTDGKPIRFRKAADGIVIYSNWHDAGYTGDALDKGKTQDPNLVRVEFRLWDENQRRQPAQPRPKVDDGGGR